MIFDQNALNQGVLVHALPEGGAEGAVAVVAALLGQPLGDNGFPCSGKLAMSGDISFGFTYGLVACFVTE